MQKIKKYKYRKMKRIAAVLLCLGMFCGSFCACGDLKSGVRPSENEEENQTDEREEFVEDSKNWNAQTALQIPVNRTEVTISLNRDQGFGRFAAADGEFLYLTDSDRKEVLAMKLGKAEYSVVPVAIPEDMQITGITTDVAGTLILLLMPEKGSERKEWFIWKLDENYAVERSISITDYVKENNYMAYDFLVDIDGYFYIRWGWGNGKILILDKEGVMVGIYKNEDLNVEEIQALGRGRDGKIYGVFRKNELYSLGRFEGAEGTLQSVCDNLFSEEEMIYTIGAGTDTDLLIYSGQEGLYACNLDTTVLVNRAVVSESQVPYQVYRSIRMILPDGRLLFVENVSEGDKLVEIRFVYLAGGE